MRHQAFSALHQTGAPLLLPNAWDVGSAVVIADAGAAAIATTSAGVAWSLGVPDGADLGAERVAEVVGRIASAVGVPVSADIEGGYADVAATTTAVIEAGASGINLEDGTRDPAEHADRLSAARAAADKLGDAIWINARTDLFLRGIGTLDEALARAERYAAAGADSLFVPGLTDLGVITELAKGPLPLAVMVHDGAPTVAELTAAGVVRISLGAAIAQAAYGLAARAAAELLKPGTYTSTKDGFPYGDLNGLLG